MKCTVIRRFKDRFTGVRYLPGDVFIHESTGRIKELTERGFIQKFDYSVLTKKAIQELLEEKGIEYDTRAKKDILISLFGGE